MAVLVVAFVTQQLLIVPKTYSAYLFLSGYGMKSGHLWELLTCQFFHSSRSLTFGLGHLALNLAGLWFVGRRVESHLGRVGFVVLVLVTGTAGALAQGLVAVMGFLLPDSLGTTADFLINRFGESVGSSNALCGLLAAFCLGKAQAPVRLWRRFAITGQHLLWLAFAAAALLIVIPSDPNLAHVGHFVGLLTGAVTYRFWEWKRRLANPSGTQM